MRNSIQLCPVVELQAQPVPADLIVLQLVGKESWSIQRGRDVKSFAAQLDPPFVSSLVSEM